MNTTDTLPRVAQSTLEARIERWQARPADERGRVIALRAAPEWDGPERLTVNGEDFPVRAASTVLGVFEALADCPGPFVLITGLDNRDFGDTVRAGFDGNEIRTVDHWETVQVYAGATSVDPELVRGDYAWLAQAAVNSPGLRDHLRARMVRRDVLLARVTAHRLGSDPREEVGPATLLEWAAKGAWEEDWGRLPEAERAGLTEYLATPGIVGDTAGLILGLAQRSEPVIGIGLVARELYDVQAKGVEQLRSYFKGRYTGTIGARISDETLRRFGEQTSALVQRWDRERSERAEAAAVRIITSDLAAPELAARSPRLASGRDGALARFAAAAESAIAALTENRRDAAKRMEAVEHAFQEFAGHQRTADTDRSAPEAARRLLYWYETGSGKTASIAEALRWQIGTGAWVDRARFVLRADGVGYGAAICESVAQRRKEIDRQFAKQLASWGRRTSESSTVMRIEDVLEKVAEPLAKASVPPLVLVVDGMSAADAASLAEDIAATRAWNEIVSDNAGGRIAALAALPSETLHSRASLLSGATTSGGQSAEDQGFKRFWSRYNRHKSTVLHRDDLRPVPGRGLPEAAREAIADTRRAVAAVLNQIDDALDSDERLANPEWLLRDLDLASDLLEEASRAGRPVILCSDHGNVRDQGSAKHTGGDGHPRWRPGGNPLEGEVLLDGERIAVPGPICAAVDEDIRYTSRKSGYHGGASLAEVCVPVLVFAPVGTKVTGWSNTGRGGHAAPVWWHGPVKGLPSEPAAAAQEDAPSLISSQQMRTGAQVTSSKRYRARVEISGGKLPDDTQVAEVIDTLELARWTLPLKVLAELLDQTPRRCLGMLGQIKRLLNEPGAEVLILTDNNQTVEINISLLRAQFGGLR
jgi:hypothetical protein